MIPVVLIIGSIILLLFLMGGWGNPPGDGKHRK